MVFILSILEVEAWFLAEHSHFERIDSSITLPAIRYVLRFDPAVDDMQLRLAPAEDMKTCYGLGGKFYAKRDAKVTVDELDYAHIYAGLADKFPDLKQLCGIITHFLRS